MPEGEKLQDIKGPEIIYSDIPETLNISREKIFNLISLDVSVDDASIPFLFDTGAMITVVNESLAKRIRAKNTGETIKGSGNAGNKICANIAVIECMRIGQSSILNKTAAVLPDESMIFEADGLEKPARVSGFLGWDIIQHFKWTIMPDSGSIHIEKPALTNTEKNMDWDTMPLLLSDWGSGPKYFGFDSGNTVSIFGQGMSPFVGIVKENTGTFTGVDGKVKKQVKNIEHIELKIGGQSIRLSDIPMLDCDVFPSERQETMGLLGADIVQGRSWSIDFYNRHFEIIE